MPCWAVCSRTSTVVERSRCSRVRRNWYSRIGPPASSSTRFLWSTISMSASRIHVGRVADARQRPGCGGRGCGGRPRPSSGSTRSGTGVISPSPPRMTCWLPSTCPVPRRERSPAGSISRESNCTVTVLSGQPLGLDVAGDGVAVARIGPHRRRQVVDAHALRASSSEPRPTVKMGTLASRANSMAPSGPAPAFCPPSLSSTTPAKGVPRSWWSNCCRASPSRVSVPAGVRNFRHSAAAARRPLARPRPPSPPAGGPPSVSAASSGRGAQLVQRRPGPGRGCC